MRYAKIRQMDTSNAPGICATLFVQGCSRRCAGCFNPDTWDFNGGKVWSKRCHIQFIELCKQEHIKNICILGGEPLDQDKQLIDLLHDIKQETDKTIWLWTGYEFEDIYIPKNNVVNAQSDVKRYVQKSILQYVDILVDGPFQENTSDKNLIYRGSYNQRIIALQDSIKINKVIHAEEYYNYKE